MPNSTFLEHFEGDAFRFRQRGIPCSPPMNALPVGPSALTKYSSHGSFEVPSSIQHLIPFINIVVIAGSQGCEEVIPLKNLREIRKGGRRDGLRRERFVYYFKWGAALERVTDTLSGNSLGDLTLHEGSDPVREAINNLKLSVYDEGNLLLTPLNHRPW